jgi:hypothetical protein
MKMQGNTRRRPTEFRVTGIMDVELWTWVVKAVLVVKAMLVVKAVLVVTAVNVRVRL